MCCEPPTTSSPQQVRKKRHQNNKKDRLQLVGSFLTLRFVLVQAINSSLNILVFSLFSDFHIIRKEDDPKQNSCENRLPHRRLRRVPAGRHFPLWLRVHRSNGAPGSHAAHRKSVPVPDNVSTVSPCGHAGWTLRCGKVWNSTRPGKGRNYVFREHIASLGQFLYHTASVPLRLHSSPGDAANLVATPRKIFCDALSWYLHPLVSLPGSGTALCYIWLPRFIQSATSEQIFDWRSASGQLCFVRPRWQFHTRFIQQSSHSFCLLQ